ncbi:hypothetical protein Tco_0670551 [Tanacetum coccineum]
MSMSSLLSLFDIENIPSTGGAQGSPVPTPFPDEPYMLESDPLETSETRLTLSPFTTPVADLTTLPSSQHPPLTQTSPNPIPLRASYYRSTTQMAVHTQPTLSPGLSDRLTEAMALSPSLFRKRYISSYDTPSSSSSSSSPTLISRKRYREDQQHQAVQAEDIAEDESLGLGYRVARRRALELARGLVTSTYEDLEDGKVYMDHECDMPPAHSPMQTLPSPVQIPSSPGSGAIREEIHSQCFRLRSLERAHEQATITFGALWRLVLALETWVGHSDAQRAALW